MSSKVLQQYFKDYKNIELIQEKVSVGVYKAQYNDEMRVIKILSLDDPNNPSNADQNKLVLRELNYSKKAIDAGNDHIMKVYAVEQINVTIYIISKYYENETLKHYLDKQPNKRLPEKEGLVLFRQLCKGYEWFVENNLIHRDLKPENIFMDGDKPAIGDLGMCRELAEQDSQASSYSMRDFSVKNVAPEQLRGEQYGTPSDIWALGIILYQILVGKFAFKESNSDYQVMESIKDDPYFPPPKELGLSLSALTLIERLLEKDPGRRISWNDLIQHDLIKGGSALKESKYNIPLKRTLTEEVQALKSSTSNKGLLVAKICAQTIKVTNEFQRVISIQRKRNFLPFGIFLPLVYGLSKIGIVRLKKTNFLMNTEEKEIKKALENLQKDAEIRRLVDFFVNLPDTPNELEALFTDDDEENYESKFRTWFNQIKESICLECWRYNVNQKYRSLYFECVKQVEQFLAPEFNSPEILSNSPSKTWKDKIRFID